MNYGQNLASPERKIMKKNKLYSVTYAPEERQKPYEVIQWDKDVNEVKHTEGWTEHFYGESPTCHREEYFVRVYAKNEEESILKSEKLINKYIKERKNNGT
jgi:hypothetical protein